MVRLCRTEFEDMIRPAVVETVEVLRRALDLAQTSPDELEAVLLVGGSSRIPLVSQMVSAELGRAVSVDSDPKAVVAAGPPCRPAVGWSPSPTAGSGRGRHVDGCRPREPLDGDRGAERAADGCAERRRRSALLVSAVVGVGAAVALSATTAAGFGPFATRPVAEQSAAAPPHRPRRRLRSTPWTGTALYAENAAGTGGDTTDGETTLAGPSRRDAVAARVRPVARNVRPARAGAPAVPHRCAR